MKRKNKKLALSRLRKGHLLVGELKQEGIAGNVLGPLTFFVALRCLCGTESIRNIEFGVTGTVFASS